MVLSPPLPIHHLTTNILFQQFQLSSAIVASFIASTLGATIRINAYNTGDCGGLNTSFDGPNGGGNTCHVFNAVSYGAQVCLPLFLQSVFFCLSIHSSPFPSICRTNVAGNKVRSPLRSNLRLQILAKLRLYRSSNRSNYYWSEYQLYSNCEW